jgi:hypothetical protein
MAPTPTPAAKRNKARSRILGAIELVTPQVKDTIKPARMIHRLPQYLYSKTPA